MVSKMDPSGYWLILGVRIGPRKGGPGSGNFGHGGRPGEVGGSSSGGGETTHEARTSGAGVRENVTPATERRRDLADVKSSLIKNGAPEETIIHGTRGYIQTLQGMLKSDDILFYKQGKYVADHIAQHGSLSRLKAVVEKAGFKVKAARVRIASGDKTRVNEVVFDR